MYKFGVSYVQDLLVSSHQERLQCVLRAFERPSDTRAGGNFAEHGDFAEQGQLGCAKREREEPDKHALQRYFRNSADDGGQDHPLH